MPSLSRGRNGCRSDADRCHFLRARRRGNDLKTGLTELRAQLQPYYGEILARVTAGLSDGSDAFLAAQSGLSEAIEYGATFGDRGFVLEMFDPVRELFRRSLATQSKSDLRADDIIRNSRAADKHFGFFVTDNALIHGDEPRDFGSFDAAVRYLVDAFEPEADELAADPDSTSVVVEAAAMWALAVLWVRPHDFGRIAEPIRRAKVAAAVRPLRDALVACAEGRGDDALRSFHTASRKVLTPKKYDYGNLGILMMEQAYLLSLVEKRGQLLNAVTQMFE